MCNNNLLTNLAGIDEQSLFCFIVFNILIKGLLYVVLYCVHSGNSSWIKISLKTLLSGLYNYVIDLYAVKLAHQLQNVVWMLCVLPLEKIVLTFGRHIK